MISSFLMGSAGEIALAAVLLAVGIALIVKGGDFFVDAASWIAEVLGLSPLLVGATIVSVATTLPELIVSIIATARGTVEIAVGNAVGSVVLRDRHKLAEDGMVVVVLPYSEYTHTLVSDPQIVTRGFIYVKEAEELMEELKRVATESADQCAAQHITDWTAIKSKVKNNISGYLYKTTRRSPMILPVITEV